MAARRQSPYRFFLLTAVIGIGALCALAQWRWSVGWTWAYAIGISAWTLLAYAYDKLAAKRGAVRIPEALLHLLTLAGGTPGAIAGRWVFRHKTKKSSFRRVFWCIVVAQLTAAAAVVWSRR